jgi:hypothetical protein
MAGHHMNWFRPGGGGGGGAKGRAMYISKAQQQQLILSMPAMHTQNFTPAQRHGIVQAMFTKPSAFSPQIITAANQAANTQIPSGVAKQKPPPAPPPAPAAPAPRPTPGTWGVSPVASRFQNDVPGATLYEKADPNNPNLVRYSFVDSNGKALGNPKGYGTIAGARAYALKQQQPKPAPPAPAAPTPPAPASAPTPSPAVSQSVSRFTGKNTTVLLRGKPSPVEAADGDLVAIKDLSGKGYIVADPRTNEILGTHADLASAKTAMQSLASTRPASHIQQQQALGTDGRAVKTIRAPLPKPGSSQNTVDDVFKALGSGSVDMLRRVEKIVGDAFRVVSRKKRWPQPLSQPGGTRGDILLAGIEQAYGFDALPQKVSSRELDAMIKRGDLGEQIIRNAGGKAYSDATLDGPHFSADAAGRVMGAGTYYAGWKNGSRQNAYNYVRSFSASGRNSLLRAAWRPDAKLIDGFQADKDARAWVARERATLRVQASSMNDREYKARSTFLDACQADVGYWAAAMGYDGLIATSKTYHGFKGHVVYNRSALVYQDTLH